MSDLTHSSRNRGFAIALVSSAVFSTAAVFIRHLTVTYGIAALPLAFWRNVFMSAGLYGGLRCLRPALLRLGTAHRRLLIVYGLTVALFNAMWTISVAKNGAAIATVLVYCSAAFTALLGRLLLEERLDAVKLLVVALSLGGCALVADALDPAAWQANPVGILAGLLSGLGFSCYSLLGRIASQRGISPWTTLFYSFALAAFFLLWINLLAGPFLPGLVPSTGSALSLGSDPRGWWVLFLLAVGPTVGGFGLYNISLGYLASSVANLILTSEPVFTTALAYLLLGERLSGRQIVGSALILSAVVLVSLHEGRAGQGSRDGLG